MTPTLKPTTKDDIPALQQVLETTQLFPSEMLPDMLGDSLSGAQAESIWLTVFDSTTAKGFCYAVPEQLADGAWNMLAIAVHPDAQGKGFGTALVAALEGHLRATGARIIIADTSGTDDFAGTRAFYAANAYEAEARIRDFWGPGDDKVVFWKSLSQT